MKKLDRQSLRLKGYDYSQIGAYFVTVCVEDRKCFFGEVVNGQMRLNDAGRMIQRWWKELGIKYPNIRTDIFIVMPNHFHGILFVTDSMVGAALRGRPNETDPGIDLPPGRPHRGAPTLGDMVRWFKTMTTNEYITGVKERGWRRFNGKLWQRNYYEHVIRGERELFETRQYIQENPLKWDLDPENPLCTSTEGVGICRGD